MLLLVLSYLKIKGGEWDLLKLFAVVYIASLLRPTTVKTQAHATNITNVHATAVIFA